MESFKALLNGVDIVVGSAASLASFEKSSLHNLVAAFEVNEPFDTNVALHAFIPSINVFLISGEPIDEILALEVIPLHGLLDEGDDGLTGHQLPILNIALDQGRLLGPPLL